jgi:hypothetical protein
MHPEHGQIQQNFRERHWRLMNNWSLVPLYHNVLAYVCTHRRNHCGCPDTPKISKLHDVHLLYTILCMPSAMQSMPRKLVTISYNTTISNCNAHDSNTSQKLQHNHINQPSQSSTSSGRGAAWSLHPQQVISSHPGWQLNWQPPHCIRNNNRQRWSAYSSNLFVNNMNVICNAELRILVTE